MSAYTKNLDKNKMEKETYIPIFLMNIKILNKILTIEYLQIKFITYKLNLSFHYVFHSH